MVAVVVLLFAAALFGLVAGALLYLSNERARRDHTDTRFKTVHRRD